MFTSFYCLPLELSQRKCLFAHGFRYAECVTKYDAKKLSQVIKLPIEQCDEILKICLNSIDPNKINIVKSDLVLKQILNKKFSSITTLCLALDNLLGYKGFPLGKVIELFGESSSGKTQLCYQLCASVQINQNSNGENAETIYIDTEMTFRPERFAEICQYTIEHFNLHSDKTITTNTKEMLDKCYVKYVWHPNQLNGLILYHMEEFLIKHKNVKLIIIDSIAFPYRYDGSTDLEDKAKNLLLLGQKLKYFAQKYDICIVMINQTTFNMEAQESLPALGNFWAHTSAIRLQLYKLNQNNRGAILDKHSFKSRQQVFYKITPQGIRDLSTEKFS